MRTHHLLAVKTAALIAAAALSLTACASSTNDAQAGASAASSAAASEASFPITIEHALGTTTIPQKPERVAAVAWSNHEVPLALGVVPVGMAAANFGDDDGGYGSCQLRRR